MIISAKVLIKKNSICVIYLICSLKLQVMCIIPSYEETLRHQGIKINSKKPPVSFKLSFQRLLNRYALVFKVLSGDFSTPEREQLL